ncbi:MAG: hypothetical protein DRP51_10340 [Candidatus Zixiibacteriota bacterium]|nr:MAG: hypothetical protein DRP51_10340 [candidate division Zixibacteria bacterium]
MYNQKTLHQGTYKSRNPDKYKGNPAKIIFRSGLELKFFRFFDHNKAVVQWNSEEVIVPYTSDLDGRMHRYFVDIWAKIKGKGGKIQEYLIEIKPFAYTKEPPQQNKKTRAYQQKVYEYIKNVNKWKAADVFAKKKGQKFIILTEKDLR